jgi:signal peptidase II
VPNPADAELPDRSDAPRPAPAGPAVAAPRRQWGVILGVAAGVLVLDQLSKWWAVRTLGERTIDVVWTLRLNLVGNTGASFSRFGGQGPLISVGAVAVVIAVLWLAPSVDGPRPDGKPSTWSRVEAVALGLILGGALGNLVDRAFRGDAGFLHGAVVDFIDFQWWPVFNVADMGVVVGAILLALAFVLAPAARGSDEPATGTGPAADAPGAGDDHG